MERDPSISKDFCLFSLFPHGNKEVFKNKPEITISLVFAGLWDLINKEIVKFGKKDTVQILLPLPDNLTYLKPLYDYIDISKYRRYNKIIENYVWSSENIVEKYIESVVDILVREEYVSTKVKVGFFSNKTILAPKLDIFENTIQKIKSEMLGSGSVSDHSIVLTILLNESGFFKNYLSKQESDMFESKINMLKSTELNFMVDKLVHEMYDDLVYMIRYVSEQ